MTLAANTERTRTVGRLADFRPRLEHLNEMVSHIGDRRSGDLQTALAVVVVDEDGVRVRVVEGPLPCLLAVGRHPACDLHLRQADASMRHAVVVADDDGVHIVDLSSSFGLAGRSAAPAGRWATVRAGDSVIAAATLRPGERVGDVDDLRALWGQRDTRARPPAAAATELRMRVLGHADIAAALPAPVAPIALAGPAQRVRPPRVIRADGGSVSIADLDAPVLIGRDDRCGLRIDNGQLNISRVHAALLPLKIDGVRRAVVVDVGSTNGTEVLRGRPGGIHEVALGPLGRGQVVDSGDLVELAGDVRLRIVGRCGDVWGNR